VEEWQFSRELEEDDGLYEIVEVRDFPPTQKYCYTMV
jgi:hypothetical protein